MARKSMKSTVGKGLLAVESATAPKKTNATFSLPVTVLDKLEEIVYHRRSETKQHGDRRKINKSSILSDLIEEYHKTIKQ